MKLPILILAAAIPAHAATHAVLPGESIQAKIDAAAPGDIIAIFGGTYPGDVSITKAVRLVEVDGQDVTITGNVTWTGVTNAPPFEGFTVGSAGKGMILTSTTGLVIKNVDARGGSGITTNGTSSLSIVGGQASAISQNGGELSALNTSVVGAFNAGTGSQKTVAARCSFQTANWNTLRAYLGYCTNLSYFTHSASNGNLIIVGCRFDRQDHTSNTISILGNNNNVVVANCVLSNSYWGSYWLYQRDVFTWPGRGILVSGSGNKSSIFNNYIKTTQSPHGYPDSIGSYIDSEMGCGIRVSNSNAQIFNNVIIGANYGITAPFGVDASNNIINSCYRGVNRGGVVPRNTVTLAPIYVASSDFVLQSTSPGVNGGVDDPIFNDLDGTRNDIGIWGGCLFDPQGWTTTKPIVISFDLAPQQLLKGVDTQINLSNGEAVAQP